MPDFTPRSPDTLERSVWVVVDPRDAVTGRRVLDPLRVRLKNVSAEPIAARSGVYCFVDLRVAPAKYTVQVEPLLDGYFSAEAEFALEAIPVAGAPLKRNPVTVNLFPRPAYALGEQTTVARGRLVRASNGAPIGGALVGLLQGTAASVRARTDERGEFVVAFPIEPPADGSTATNSKDRKKLKFRLRFILAGRPDHDIAEREVEEGAAISLKDITFPGS